MLLRLTDILLTLLHLSVIGFNLCGWIWKKTRRLHLVVITATAACWFILGIWYGVGYCPLTDWEWQIKEKLGESNLPGSFIKYFADKLFHRPVDAWLIDDITGIAFFCAATISLYVNFFIKKRNSPMF